MFRDDVTSEERRAALALRIDAARYDPAAEPESEGHRRLAALISSAPKWLISSVSWAMFRDDRDPDHPEQGMAMVDFARGLGMDGFSFGLSRIDLRTAILCRLGRLPDATEALAAFEGRLRKEEIRQEKLDPAGLEWRRKILGYNADRPYTLRDAMERRQDEARKAEGEAKHPAFNPADAFQATAPESDGGLRVRRMKQKEIMSIARAWADGWGEMSAGSVLGERMPGVMGRFDKARKLDSENRLFGIFDRDGRLVGSVAVSPASLSEAELGWFVVPEERGKGVAVSAVAAVMGRLSSIGVERFGARTRATNSASLRVMEKLGFRADEGHVAIGSDVDWVSMTTEYAPSADTAASPGR